MDQHAMKIMSDSQQLVDFAVRVVNPVIYMPDRQANFFGKITEEQVFNEL